MMPSQSELMQPASKNESEAGQNTQPGFWQRKADWFVLAALSLVLIVFFAKTIFAGGSISRLCVLAEWDSVFDAWRSGRPQPYDPSLVQIFLPDYVFLAKNLSQGVLPLWNPHCGLGYPFLADIQSSVFAPIRAIYDFFPNLRTYNLYLILELLVCTISSFYLAKALGLSRAASAFSSLAYTFCPYNMWYMEMNLGASSCLFPLCALSFAHAADKRTVGSAVLAGLASAVLILSGHPECSFFGIMFSSALLFLLVLLSPFSSFGRRLLSAFKLLTLAALSTLAFSAPALFPFLEYLLNAESYKYGATYSTPVTWNGILFNLANPGQNGASPYLGIIAAILFPMSIFAIRRASPSRHKFISLLVLTASCFLLVSQLGPVQAIFTKAPFTAIITRYALPYLLLLLALLAGVGLDKLARLCQRKEAAGTCFQKAADTKFASFFAFVFLLLVPASIFLFSQQVSHNPLFMKAADFDAMLPSTAFNAAAWRRDLICTVIFAAIALVCLLFGRRIQKVGPNQANALILTMPAAIILTAALVLSFVSEGSLSKLSLPQQAKFYYPSTELLEKLQDKQYRSISTCNYVLRPASNAVYGINFLTMHNPLFPRRFLEFNKACGAHTDVFNQDFDTKISPLLNLASVKYVLALGPISDARGRTEERFSLAFQSKNQIKIYQNKDAVPRAFLVDRCRQVSSPQEALNQITASDFDPRKQIIVESNKKTSNKSADEQASQQNLESAYHEVESFETPNPNTIKISSKTKSPSWLVLTDIHYPGWNAYVDGQKTEIKHADFAFRGLKLSAGAHQIVFSYEPMSFAFASAFFACYCLFAAWAIATGIWKKEL